MDEKNTNMKKVNGFNLSAVPAKNNVVNSNEESFVIPFEAACSHEFSEGCFIMEDEADKHSEEK